MPDAALLALARTARRRAAQLAFERRHGVQTNGIRPASELGYLEDDERHPYGPAGWLVLRKILHPAQVSGDDVFADLGAGMGRVLVQAARYPFRRIIGVELSPDLAAAAEQNVRRMGARGRHIEIVNTDVTSWEVPADLSVVFLNNPFSGAIFSTCIERLIDSVDRHPRRLRLIYLFPLEHDRLIATGRFRPVRRVRPRWPASSRDELRSWTVMYELLPRGDGRGITSA